MAHFSEVLLCLVLVMMLGFVTFMGHVHNDSLASKGIELAGQVLAALLTLMVASKQSAPPTGTTTSTVSSTTATPEPPHAP